MDRRRFDFMITLQMLGAMSDTYSELKLIDTLHEASHMPDEAIPNEAVFAARDFWNFKVFGDSPPDWYLEALENKSSAA